MIGEIISNLCIMGLLAIVVIIVIYLAWGKKYPPDICPNGRREKK